LSSPGDISLIAQGAQIQGYLSLYQSTVRGVVTLSSARVSGGIFLTGGHFANPGGAAIRRRDTDARILRLNEGILVDGIGAGTLVFGLDQPPPLIGTPHPAFNPLVYTVDLLVPPVNLGLRETYAPQGGERWLAYLLIAVGWIFVTTIAAGIARVLHRQ
jgi:hypothetical protein